MVKVLNEEKLSRTLAQQIFDKEIENLSEQEIVIVDKVKYSLQMQFFAEADERTEKFETILEDFKTISDVMVNFEDNLYRLKDIMKVVDNLEYTIGQIEDVAREMGDLKLIEQNVSDFKSYAQRLENVNYDLRQRVIELENQRY